MEIAMMRAQPPRKVVNALPLLKASLYLMTLPSGGSSLEESIQTLKLTTCYFTMGTSQYYSIYVGFEARRN